MSCDRRDISISYHYIALNYIIYQEITLRRKVGALNCPDTHPIPVHALIDVNVCMLDSLLFLRDLHESSGAQGNCYVV